MSLTDTSLAGTSAGRPTNAKHSKSPLHPASSKVKRISAPPKPATAPKTSAVTGKAMTKVSRGKGSRTRRPNAISASPARHDDSSGGSDASILRKGTKLALLIEMLSGPDGASLDELGVALGWQVHSIRGAISGALKKKLALTIETRKVEGRGRVYRNAG